MMKFRLPTPEHPDIQGQRCKDLALVLLLGMFAVVLAAGTFAWKFSQHPQGIPQGINFTIS